MLFPINSNLYTISGRIALVTRESTNPTVNEYQLGTPRDTASPASEITNLFPKDKIDVVASYLVYRTGKFANYRFYSVSALLAESAQRSLKPYTGKAGAKYQARWRWVSKFYNALVSSEWHPTAYDWIQLIITLAGKKTHTFEALVERAHRIASIPLDFEDCGSRAVRFGELYASLYPQFASSSSTDRDRTYLCMAAATLLYFIVNARNATWPIEDHWRSTKTTVKWSLISALSFTSDREYDAWLKRFDSLYGFATKLDKLLSDEMTAWVFRFITDAIPEKVYDYIISNKMRGAIDNA